jgi:hypothetical protein
MRLYPGTVIGYLTLAWPITALLESFLPETSFYFQQGRMRPAAEVAVLPTMWLKEWSPHIYLCLKPSAEHFRSLHQFFFVFQLI